MGHMSIQGFLLGARVGSFFGFGVFRATRRAGYMRFSGFLSEARVGRVLRFMVFF